MNTMLSQNFTHIGAGISQGADGYYYFAWCGDSRENSLCISQYMVPVALSTARPDGDVFHKVQYGQSLWIIAIEYGTTIKNIQALNYLGGDLVVYQGQQLLVKKAATQPALPPSTALPIVTVTSTMIPASGTPSLSLPAQLIVSPTFTPTIESPVTNAQSSKLLVGILIFAAFVGAGCGCLVDPRPELV